MKIPSGDKVGRMLLKKMYGDMPKPIKQVKLTKLHKENRKKAYKRQKIEMFGKVRYYLAWWFGEWILYI